jgi:signal transduction histidine kinase
MTDQEVERLKAESDSLRRELEACKRQVLQAYQLTAVGNLLASIIHEVNTPIGSILSNCQVEARDLESLKQLLAGARISQEPPPVKSVELIDTIESLLAVDKIACERIMAVVRGLKTLCGGSCGEFVKSNINEILDNTIKLARCEFRQRVKVETDYGALPEICCEPHQMGQVFLNLLVNAGQAISGEGTVVVRTRSDGRMVHVSVTDSGSGIAPEHRDKIFSAGFTTKPAGAGTGLGLAISKDIVVGRHGGVIDFESELGRGTTFNVRVPVVQPPEQHCPC